MRVTLLLLVLGALMLTAEATVSCYTDVGMTTQLASCAACSKTVVLGTVTSRGCTSLCPQAVVDSNNGVWCCSDKNLCNSAQQLRGFSWLLLLLPAAALVALGSRME